MHFLVLYIKHKSFLYIQVAFVLIVVCVFENDLAIIVHLYMSMLVTEQFANDV